MGERRLEVFGRGHLTFQVPLHHGVVSHDDALDQGLTDAMLEFRDLLGDRAGRGLACAVEDRRVGQEVSDSVKGCLVADGQLQRGNAGAEALPELIQGPLEVGPLAVELVDEHEPRDAELGRQPPGLLGLDLYALDGTDHQHGQVGNRQAGLDLGYEIGVPGGVDDVDLAVLVEERSQRQ